MNNKPLIIITGPTAVGKTGLSIKAAQEFGGEIISADSMQVYKTMDIGTAKITKEEMRGIRHYMIDVLTPEVPFNVASFCEMAQDAISEIYEHGKIPIIVGGTGFYIQALLYGVDFSEGDENTEYRKALYEILDLKGNICLHEMLREADYESYLSIHPNNIKRVVRALEYYHETGTKISDHNKAERENESEYNFAYFVINDKREEIYSRIDRRVDKMVEQGLFDEVKGLIDKGYGGCQSMLGIGYKEICDYYNGLCTENDAVENIKKETRHYAKKQLTWFKREKDVVWLNRNEFEDPDRDIIDRMREVLIDRDIFSIH